MSRSALAEYLRCFAHCINLGVVDVMGCITRKAAIETTNAIWDYDPLLEKNRMMNGSLDAVAALRTLAVKIQASGQRIQQFNKLQLDCGIDKPYKITMHGNTRWGTAFGMMDRGIKLGKVRAFLISNHHVVYMLHRPSTFSYARRTSFMVPSRLSDRKARSRRRSNGLRLSLARRIGRGFGMGKLY